MPPGLFAAVSGNENGPESVHGTTIIGNGLSTALLDQAVFCTAMQTLASTRLENGDEIGLMPFISEDGSKNLYMYSPSSYIGISRRLTEPGNEEKLENAVKLLSLLFSIDCTPDFYTAVPCGTAVRRVLI